MTEIRKLDQKMIETEAFALVTIYDDKSCSLEFSNDLSKNSVSRYLSKDFKWIGFFEKKVLLRQLFHRKPPMSCRNRISPAADNY